MLLTLSAYRLGRRAYAVTGGHALAQPLLVAIVVVGAAVTLLDVDHSVYRDGTELITCGLGPASVALAVPLHRQVRRMCGLVLPMLLAIPLAAVVSIGTAYAPVLFLGDDEQLAVTGSRPAS